MDRVKAIKVLKPLIDSFVDYANITMKEEDDDIVEALEMAVEALDVPDTNVGDMIDRRAALDIYDDYNVAVENGELEAYGKHRKRLLGLPSAQPATNCSEIPNGSDDTISRQAAIDAMGTWNKFGCDPNGILVWYDDNKHYVPYVRYDDMVYAIKSLPSAQPEQVCVATVMLTDEQVKEAVEKAKNAVVSVIESEPHWISCSERLPEENGQYLITVRYKHVDGYEDVYAEHGDWCDGNWDMFCFGHCGEVESILAWMPLPEPYRG